MLCTVNIQSGHKLASRKCDEILEAVLAVFSPEMVKAVQVGFDIICVTFRQEKQRNHAMSMEGIRLFDIFSSIHR